jgi:peptidyl-prolyl cis-trans isomerase C
MALLVLVGCRPEPGVPFDAGNTLATVNGDVLDEQFYFDSYIDWLTRTGYNDEPLARQIHLQNSIDILLLAQEARRRGMHRDPSFMEHVSLMRDAALGGRYLQAAAFDTLGPVSDTDIRRAFVNTHRKVYVRQLFFLDEGEARGFHQRLSDGEAFVDLANELYKTGTFDPDAGMVGDIAYFGADDAFTEAAFALSMFDVSPVVRTRQGWVIIRMENENRNPLMRESDFENRRNRLRSLMTERRVNLAGDRFVRTHMSRLNPVLDADAFALLSPYLTGLPPTMRIEPNEVRRIRSAITAESPLVRYRIGDREQVFTVGQFMRWLPVLPVSEVRSRPGAAVGRALRNEVLAREGESAHLDRDPKVRWQLNYVSTMRLADDLRRSMPGDSATARLIGTLRAASSIRLDEPAFKAAFP